MIYSAQSVLSDHTYHGQEVTVRCTVDDEPRSGRDGGNKTLYPIQVGGHEKDSFLSVWHESPSWTDAFGPTAKPVRDAFQDIPLQDGETVLARGVPNSYKNKWYFNVTELAIRDPDTAIGKSEMRSANECPRIYNLRFEKNVYSPGRYDLSPGSIKGRIVHSLVERAAKENFQERFERGWLNEEVEEYLEDLIERQYSVEMALCRLAWISPNAIKDHALNAATRLLTDEEFTDRVANAEQVDAEIGLSSSVGFNGRVDLVLDGIPYDLKTNYQLKDYQRRHHRFQLRIYLLAFILETLDDGERLGDKIENGVVGYLVYPNLADESDAVIEEVRLREADVEDILSLRNEASVLRDGFGVPTTYGRDCEGCTFKTATTDANEEEILPAPCQFHCQSERRWDCFETDEQGEVITQCPLFDECEQRLEYRNPAITDHYTALRQGLNTERQKRQELGSELDRMSPQTLVRAGLRIPALEIEALEGQRRIIFSSDTDSVPSFSPGDSVRLKQTGTEYYQDATFYGQMDNQFIFQLDTKPNTSFLDPTATYEAVRTIAGESLPRELLRQLDYAQRGEVSPLLESAGESGDALDTVAPESVEKISNYTINKELYIDIPVRSDRNTIVTEIVATLATQRYPMPMNDGMIPDGAERVLVLSTRPEMTDQLDEQLSSVPNTVRMDGFAGGHSHSISSMTDGHEIYESLREASVVISTAGYALSEDVFHAMRDGDESVRQHSDKFFDTVILVGAETLVEPQFHFLSVLADRTVAIGDTHQLGPEMVSGEAREARLDESYFNRLYRRFANIENDDSQSVQITGELIAPMQTAFEGLDLVAEIIDGTFEFVHIDGSAGTAVGEIALNYGVPPAQDETDTRFLRLAPADRVDTLQITRAFENIRSLDASVFTMQETYTIQDIRFEVRSSTPIEEDVHQVEINVPLHATPYLHRRLTQNEKEAEKVVEVCATNNPDIIVTPFAAQANMIRKKLTNEGLNVPVRLPHQLSGTLEGNAVVSLAVTGEERIVTPPVSEIETLYTIFNSARDVILVGDQKTLERNSLIARLLEEP